MDPMELLMLLGVLAVLVAAIWLITLYLKMRKARRADSPHVLFGELCRAQGLDWSSRQLLSALARVHRLQNTAQLFVDPQLFDPQNIGNLASRRVEIITLRDRLFATSATQEPESDRRGANLGTAPISEHGA
jgi:hypothetical protein